MQENPRGIGGLLDISARKTVQRSLGSDKLTFSMPYRLFLEMVANIPGSFPEKAPWLDIY